MRVLAKEAQHAVLAEPRRQAVDQMRERGAVLGLHQILLRRRDGFRGQYAKPDAVETEFAFPFGACEFVRKQTMQMRRLVQRPAGADLDPVDLPVDAEEARAQLARALPALFEKLAKPFFQPREHGKQILIAQQRLGKTLLDAQGRHRRARAYGFFFAAQSLVQTTDEFGAKPRGKRAARPDHDVADGFQAELNQPVARLLRQTQSGQRQRRQRRFCFPRRNNRCLAVARGRPGGADRIGNADAGMKPLRLQACQQIAGKRCLAAEKMRDAGDVEEETIGRIEAHQRRIALAPSGRPGEQTRILGRRFFRPIERGMHRAGIGKAHAHAQAEPRGRIVYRSQDKRIPGRADQRKRPPIKSGVRRRPRLARHPIGRKTAQP